MFYTNGQVILGQVEEIGLEQVRYRTSSAGNAVLIVVDKHDLSRIKLQGGQEYPFSSTVAEARSDVGLIGRKHEVSFDVIAPALNHLTIGYEQALGKNASLVVKAGYVGIWRSTQVDNVFNSKGGFVTAGVKFTLPHGTRRIPSVRDTYPLAGWYLRPELVYSAWTQTNDITYNYYYDPKLVRNDYVSMAVMLSIGRKLFLGERFTFDLCGGLGYGAQWRNGKPTESGPYSSGRSEYSFSHAFVGEVTPLVLAGSLRFGYTF